SRCWRCTWARSRMRRTLPRGDRRGMAERRRCLAGWLLRAAGVPLAALPQPALLALARTAARLTRPLQRRRARIAATNLALCLPGMDPQARDRLCRETLDQAAIGLFEMLRAWYAPPARLAPLYTVEGREHLLAAQREGRGT